MSNPTMGELITTTLRYRRRFIADATSKNTAMMFHMRRKGKIKLIGGGRTISEPLMFGENANFQFYQGREALNVAGQEVMTSAEFAWKQYACGVSISGLELMQNASSPTRVHDIMAQRIANAEKTIANKVAESSYSDGTGSSGKEFGGIDLLISDTAGATVGGIPSATATYWENFRVAVGTNAFVVGNAYANMENVILNTNRNKDSVDLILADNNYFSVFSQSQHAIQRHMDAKMASAGFNNLLFQNVPVVADGGLGGFAPKGMFFLNCDALCMYMHKKRNNTILGAPRRPLTEDSDTVIIAGMGNFATNNRMLHGRLTD
ncbi:MAG: phage major capsid protein [Pseudomonadota bacterium]